MKRLVIDLGHGGKDSGAVGVNKTYESNVVLAIGRELNELLKPYDIEYRFTRLSNTYITLKDRVSIANNFKADYFISIHINSSTNTSTRGTEVYQYSNRNDALNRFSSNVSKDISSILNISNRGVKLSQGLYVLKYTTMPACLIEVDFISNVNAERDLNNSDNISAIALAIRNNILDLFNISRPTDTTLYRVCIGAYRDRNNAINQVNLAKERGFTDAYIIWCIVSSRVLYKFYYKL